jgi:hypothetical protein
VCYGIFFGFNYLFGPSLLVSATRELRTNTPSWILQVVDRRPKVCRSHLSFQRIFFPQFFTKIFLVGQLPQTSYHSLLTPYAYFGLGRTNNYIENLFVGSTKHTDQHFINMEGVIPNSKVVILPPDGGEDGAAWKRELFLRPGEWIPWVTFTVVIGTAILAVIVFVLHLNEKVGFNDFFANSWR